MNNEEKILGLLERLADDTQQIKDRLTSVEDRLTSVESGLKALEADQRALREKVDGMYSVLTAVFDETSHLAKFEESITKDLGIVRSVVKQNSFDIARLQAAM